MKKLITLMIICTLISGCGLFKRNNKDVLIAKSSAQVEQTTSTDLKVTDNSKTLDVNTSVKSEVSKSGHNVNDGGITLHPDGSIIAEGDVSLSGYNDNVKNQKDSLNRLRQSNVDYSQKAEEAMKVESKGQVKEVQITSEPSGRGIIFGAIGLLTIVLGILWSVTND